ncbi:hypothetical protein [Rhodanobacter sp. DHB23]|uniref:hypothetical protein n=1 Tax=Rhodanobacter sp. DHB23 TaxID=2775923 RepID=UPI001786CB4E|nr:hypothetical protein [Rhodanobacter sp. DHB23]MBD8873117.1 hypothetical protein [Rhodanobacter sp. DHB23]
MRLLPNRWQSGRAFLAAAFVITILVYWPGLHGGWLFDDFPNIVDNQGVQPHDASLSSLVGAALSSPSSEFKRPLSSLSFAANYLAGGLDPFGWKLANLVIHLLNGALVFLLARMLLARSRALLRTEETDATQADVVAALIAGGWMLLPINLTGVLYVVQRMESLANLFVMLGLIGYVAGRQRMLGDATIQQPPASKSKAGWGSFCLCTTSIVLATAVGVLAKETAVMLPLYALLIEWALFRFSSRDGRCDWRVPALFTVVLALPLIAGMAWLAPQVVNPGYWSTRDFTLGTRLLSEARIVVDYVAWTLCPTSRALSFYHDNFVVSTGLFAPWTTLASIAILAGLVALAAWLRPRRPLVALGIALFLGCQLLTGTVLPLELVYEHRNYFASFGLLLAVVPLLAVPMAHFMALPRRVLLGGLLLLWTGQTAITAVSWGNPLLLAETLVERAPDSPRAQYELGRLYIIYSNYSPTSPFTRLAYAPLEHAAALPDSSILPQQALIFLNSRMHLPIKDAWWDSMIAKLKARRPGVQDESSLGALTQCIRHGECDLPASRMVEAYLAALSHPDPSARLLAMYGDYAWNVLDDHALGERMLAGAVEAAPNEPAYHITLARMLLAQNRPSEAERQVQALEILNVGGRLNRDIANLQSTVPASTTH